MENKLRRLNSVKVWVKNVIDKEVANERIVESFEERYVQQNTEVDPNAEPVNILVLVRSALFLLCLLFYFILLIDFQRMEEE